jgi:hypothetical protein
MFKLMILVPFLVVLGACTPAQQERASVIAINKCPALKIYSREQLRKAAQELRNIPNESQLSIMLSDYSKLRDACRIAEQRLRQMNKK